LGKRWAKYLTIISTSSFIPLEVYELHFGKTGCAAAQCRRGCLSGD
jgi:uncharacterized membrane protein (DUF2068 family)